MGTANAIRAQVKMASLKALASLCLAAAALLVLLDGAAAVRNYCFADSVRTTKDEPETVEKCDIGNEGCVKISQYESNELILRWYGCASKFKSEFPESDLPRANGCKTTKDKNADNKKVKEEVCFCDDRDACNSATITSIAPAAIHAFSAVVATAAAWLASP